MKTAPTTIELPWPPSVNHYWRTWKGRTLISREGRDYRQVVLRLLLVHKAPKFGQQRIRLDIEACPPDRHRRDLSNTLKATEDALEAAGVYEDDEQIDDLRIRRGEVVKGGRLRIHIESLEADVE